MKKMIGKEQKYKRQGKKTSKKKTETWSSISPLSSRRGQTFTHVTSLWQNRFIIITISVSPLDLSVPFPIILKTDLPVPVPSW